MQVIKNYWSSLPIEGRWGLLIGLGMSLWVLGEFLLGLHTNNRQYSTYVGYLSLAIPIFGLYRGLVAKRDQEYSGVMTYWQGMKSGAWMCVATAGTVAAFFYFYNTVLNPSWVEQGIEMAKEQMIKDGLSASESASRIEQLKTTYTLPNQLLSIFYGVLTNNLLFTAVIALIVRKKATATSI